MNCQEYKEWFRRGEEPSNEGLDPEAYLHVKTCPECGAVNRMDAVLENKIRKDLSIREVPDGLLQKVELNMKSASALQRKSSVLRKVTVPALAAAVLILLFISHNLKNFRSMEEIGRLSVESHMENLPMMFRADGVKDVGLWFRDKLSFPVSIPDIGEQGLRLIGGRKCKLGRNEVAYLFYQKNNKRISLYIIDPKKVKYEMEDNTKYHFPFKECKVEIWKNNEMVYSLVK